MKKWLAFLWLGAFAAPAAAQPQPAPAPREPLPLAVFARLPEMQQVRISTDGKALAFRLRVNGEPALAVLPLDEPNARPQIVARDSEFDQREGYRTTGWSWIDPDTLVIAVAQRTTLEGDPTDATRVIAYNRRTRITTRLGWPGTFVRSNLLWMSREGPPRVLLQRLPEGRGYERLNNPEIIEVDVTSGRTRLVEQQRRGVSNWFADGQGNVRMGISRDADSGRLSVLYRSGGDGNFRTIIRERTERYQNPPVPIAFLPGDRALAISRHEGYSALYEVDLNTMDFTRKVFGLANYDIDDVDLNVEQNAVDGIDVTEDRSRTVWMNPRLREIQQALDETFGAGMASIVSTDRPRTNIIAHVGGPDQAGAYYLYNVESGSIRNLGWVNSALRDMRLNPVRTVRYRASDGREIAAVLTLPRLREARNLPLIVLPHGGPWARDSESWDIWAQPLAEQGYAVIQPNFRGSSGFGRDWEAASDGNWGMRMQDDLNDSVAYLAQQGIADSSRVCMFGWSYGGYASSRAAQRDPDRYRCAISGAGVHDIPDMVTHDRDYLGRYGSQYIGSAAGRLADVSPARHTSGRWAPIMIVHGARDERVPVAQSRTLVSRLRSSGKVEGRDFVYVEQPRNTHNLPLEADRLQLLVEMQRFLAQHNPSGQAATAAAASAPATGQGAAQTSPPR
ncbi:MAG TPA: alpha/beta fold hydrolase [Allosphingosinicella sp.]|nr:alpha/beta fold hydrolase [Allosphingosinicella sp.]